MSSHFIKILTSTKNNIVRNSWLSIATVLVTTIVFTTASIFIALSLLAHRAVKISETQAQIQIYFQLETPETEITKIREVLKDNSGVDSVKYISREEALKLYTSYYSEDPELTESVSEEWLPASLTVKAKSLDDLTGITEFIREEKKTNPYIEDVQYHEDIVNQLRSLSFYITIGAVGIIALFLAITISLIVITIAFNIRSHKNEIEIMHLVGSSDRYIKLPFILEGTFYTVVGSLFAALFILIPWLIVVNHVKDSNIHFLLTDLIKVLKLGFLKGYNPLFITLFLLIHLLFGIIVGFTSSSAAVMKHLNLKEK